MLMIFNFRTAWSARGFHYWFWPAAALALGTIVISVMGLATVSGRGSAVLHYSPAFGIDRIGPWQAAYIPAVFAGSLLAINTALAGAYYEKYRPISFLIGIFTVLYEIGFLVAAALIVLLNR